MEVEWNSTLSAWTLISGSDPLAIGALQKSANLSDLANAQTALTNLGLTGIGIGLPSMIGIQIFDFQTFAFTLGANYIADSTNWINVPTEISYPAGLAISIKVDYVVGTHIGLEIKPSTVSSANFRVWYLRLSGNPGSRTFTAIEARTSANKIPASGTDVATNAEVAAGTVDKLVNVPGLMSLFSKRSFTTNNYIRIPDVPGGLIIQWCGGVTTTTGDSAQVVTFPIPFPTAVLNLSVTTIAGSQSVSDAWFQQLAATLSNCTVVAQYQSGGNVSGGVTPRILAIGY
jgi:hypothetical protein